MEKELVVYTRTTGCPYVRLAKRVLAKYGLPFREVPIDQNPQALMRVQVWTGFASVPTLVVARPGEDFPITEPVALERGSSPRGINRGSLITEPNEDELTRWLQQHGFIA